MLLSNDEFARFVSLYVFLIQAISESLNFVNALEEDIPFKTLL